MSKSWHRPPGFQVPAAALEGKPRTGRAGAHTAGEDAVSLVGPHGRSHGPAGKAASSSRNAEAR